MESLIMEIFQCIKIKVLIVNKKKEKRKLQKIEEIEK